MNTFSPSCDADGPASAAGPAASDDRSASGPTVGEGGHPVDHARIERAVREILLAVGEDPDR